MKYFLNAAVLVIFGFIFIGCAGSPITNEELNASAISQDFKYPYFSGLKKGYARMIIYRPYKYLGWVLAYSMLMKYENSLQDKISRNENDYQNVGVLANNRFIIVDMRANRPVSLTYWGSGQVVGSDQSFIFIPKSQKIYCVRAAIVYGWLIGAYDFNVVDKAFCSGEFGEMYSEGKGHRTPIKLVGPTKKFYENKNENEGGSKCFGAGC